MSSEGKTETPKVKMIYPEQSETKSLTHGPKFFLPRDGPCFSRRIVRRKKTPVLAEKNYLSFTWQNNITPAFVFSKY